MSRVILIFLFVVSAKTAFALKNDLQHRLNLYRQMYYEVEFTAEPEELEYLQRKIQRLEQEITQYGASCSLTLTLAEVN